MDTAGVHGAVGPRAARGRRTTGPVSDRPRRVGGGGRRGRTARSGGRWGPTAGAVGRWGPTAGAVGRRGPRAGAAGEGRRWGARQGLAATVAEERPSARGIERERERQRTEKETHGF